MGFIGLGIDALLILAIVWLIAGCRVSLHNNLSALPVLAAACVIGVAELLSLFSVLASPSAWISVHLGLFVVAGIIRLLLRSSSVAGGFEQPGFHPHPTSIETAAKDSGEDRLTWNLVLVLGVVLCGVYAILAWLCVKVPPNNWDSLTYHLSRVGYYLQQGHLGHFTTPNYRQTDFPWNAELLILWTVVFLRSDAVANLVQWIAALAGALAAFETMVALGCRKSTAALVSLVFLSLPMVVFQATSTQNDLVITWSAQAALLYAVRFQQRPCWPDAMLFGLSMGMAVGTKNTMLLTGPGFAVLFLVICVNQSQTLSQGFRLGLATLIGIGMFGAFWAAENVRSMGHVFSTEESATQRIDQPGLQSLTLNLTRYAYQWCDLTGLPSRRLFEDTFADAIQSRTIALLGPERHERWNDPRWTIGPGNPWPTIPYTLHEDLAWFGPNAWLCLLPAVIVGFIWSIAQQRWLLCALLLPAASFVIFDCWFLKWQPWAGRLYCLPVGLSLPLVAIGWDTIRSNRIRHCWQGVAVVIAIMTAVQCGLHNSSKRFSAARRENALALRFPDRPEMERVARWVMEQSRPGLRIGFFGHSDDGDYVSFLPRFEMHVTRYFHDPQTLKAAIENDDLDLIVARSPRETTPDLPPNLVAARLSDTWLVIRRQKNEEQP